ncbi:hypothetical protein PGH12_04735 [Chryseobacterium wangxinyae]|uniref:hypothetical protein n=1 Tax=Chryseobacterium sp. CY350 TaxID=2997336 RepID=UPI00226ED875|nr:hypothetical protein [Chryseobacterium sp. CY350]MCY0979405.1 hypothetical protein [Chryseobacterium sp. CY350]WBZ96456.1 hypothetical protein PGH12_04735 [Chryseobacterium sp. CY350]
MKYYIILIFLNVNLFSQVNITIKEQCKSEYDSIFKEFFGEKFFKKSIKYNKDESYINLFLTNDIENDDDFKMIFLNVNNQLDIQKYRNDYPNFDYLEHYNYNFLYKGKVFYKRIFLCELVNDKEVLYLINKEILEYYNKIKNKEYLSPKKALKIAKANGMENICYQSLTSASLLNKNQDVWQIKDCSNKEKAKVVELDPKSGEVLTIYERYYEKADKAAYWNLLK